MEMIVDKGFKFYFDIELITEILHDEDFYYHGVSKKDFIAHIIMNAYESFNKHAYFSLIMYNKRRNKRLLEKIAKKWDLIH